MYKHKHGEPSHHEPRGFIDQWLKKVVEKWKKHHQDRGETLEDAKLHPEVASLKELYEKDRGLHENIDKMFTEVPGDRRREMPVKNFSEALVVINHIMNVPPEFNHTGMVGCPIGYIFNVEVPTEAGYKVFRNEQINERFRSILNAWGEFLTSPESCKYLNDGEGGWFSEDALKKMPHFADTFVCDPSQPHWGFKSWNDFFTRSLRPNARPVEEPDDDSIINSACEACPYQLVRGVKEHDQYWAKGQPYSLADIFKHDPTPTEKHHDFIGGTIYQGFLSPFFYHRWHSPVNGKIARFWIVEGTYFSEAPYETQGDVKGNDTKSQGYMAETATRAIVLIDCDNRDIGLMAFVAIGMFEVSTCEVTVKEGQTVKKGQELGLFHFGGSTHLLVFRPEVKVDFCYFGDNTPSVDSHAMHINSKIARVEGQTTEGKEKGEEEEEGLFQKIKKVFT